MSSASSGRYQSRLFNFVRKQSRRFTKQCDRALGHIQATTNWVAAVGLYPILLLFQSTQRAAKQLHSSVQQSFPQLSPAVESQPQTPPTVDTPIQQVLLLVDALSSESAISTPPSKPEPLKNLLAFLVSWRFKYRSEEVEKEKPFTSARAIASSVTANNAPRLNGGKICTAQVLLPTSNRPLIQGIATQLSSRALVLVSVQNEILDILTPQQQQKLQAEIIAKVGDYWRYRTKQGQKSLLHRSSDIDPLTPSPVLAFLDRKLAKVESNHFTPVWEVAIAISRQVSSTSGQLVQQVQSQFGASLSTSRSPAAADNSSATQTIRIQTLIGAAIDYFFGSHDRKPLEQNQSKSKSISGKASQNLPQAPNSLINQPLKLTASTAGAGWRAHLPSGGFARSFDPNIEDPWLSESDLFGDSVVVDEILTESQTRSKTMMSRTKKTSVVLPSNRSSNYYLGKLVNNFRNLFLPPKPASEIVKEQKINNGKVAEISTKQSPPLFRSPQLNTAGEISTSFSTQTTGMEAQPDWIETNATVIGYVKHPLEQLLAWLDSLMLWLEEMLLKIWQWLKLSSKS
ncbi:MAG TPA: hypothetical protein DEV81_21170 [Cyanobacteria bacterium UBA11049]|nr:hypothetical protein [Cyanobacteria bacterium UBA11049]